MSMIKTFFASAVVLGLLGGANGASAAEKRILANGVNLNVDVRGQGEPALVFLHYWGGSSRTWDGVIRHLDGDRRTVAIDFRGWGNSDKPAMGYRIEELASDVTATIAALKLSRYILVGHSMGGKVAELIASGHPAGLAGLVLVAPSATHGGQVPDERREQMIHAYDTAESVAIARDKVLTKRSLSDDLKAQVVEDSLKGSQAAKLAWPNVAIPQDISEAAASISTPTLVIAGEFDRVDPPAALEKDVVGIIPNSRFEIVHGIGHLSPLEAPEEVAILINSFVEKLK
jgi:pimeloyl-ACP methyl ester carboxylesterase